MGSLDGHSILVTGGTGSFGQEFVRRLLEKHKPRRVVVFSRDELKQYEMQQELNFPNLRYFIGDVRDQARLERALDGIDTIVHAAALKQVVAAEYNPMECILTNIMGAENIINAAIDRGVKRVVALSTDKAVNPINLYGATKLCSDKLFIAANHLAGGRVKFSVVRYGNVIGSRGSVIPVFERLRSTGKLPITDERMTRFWITVSDGAAFVERCLGLMKGGEIFVPKISSVRIVDLARAIAPECKHDFIGIRPGEKLHEILIPRDEARQTVEFKDFYVVRTSISLWGEDRLVTYDGETGTPVSEDFAYESERDSDLLSPQQIRDMAARARH